MIVFFESLPHDQITDEAAVNDFLDGRLVLLGGIGFVQAGENTFKLID